MTIHIDRSTLAAPSRREFMVGAAGATFAFAIVGCRRRRSARP